MSRRPATVTQADIARTLRAIEQIGSDRVIEIARDGTIRIVPPGLARPEMAGDVPRPADPVDDDGPIIL